MLIPLPLLGEAGDNIINPSQKIVASITGIVLDNQTSEPVIAAAVQLLEKDIFTTTDVKGGFTFTDLPEGRYRFKVTHLAYQETIVEYTIAENSRNLLIFLQPKSIAIDPVVVTDRLSRSKFDEFDELTNVLKGRELQRDQALSLAATLRNETGLAVRSMGPAPARPVIRGLGGDRVQINEDDVSSADLSASSPDHAVAVEPFTIERIEVLRGPKILIHNPTTIGGLVNIVREEIPLSLPDQIHGNIGFYGETVNKGYLGGGVLQLPLSPFSLRIEGTNRKADDISTPAGKLLNSYLHTRNFNGGLSYIMPAGYIGVSYREFLSDYGIPGGFVGAHPNGVDIEMRKRYITLKSEYQLNSDQFPSIELSLNRTFYRHVEYENSGLIGAEFAITTHQGYLHLNNNTLAFINNGTTGFSFEVKDFNIGGYVFTPPVKSLKLSGFTYQTFNHGKFHYEAGARYSFDNYSPAAPASATAALLAIPRKFNSLSLSLSLLYEITQEIHAGGNISSSSRVPTIEELYSRGPHLAAYSFETGNPNLPLERGIGTEIFLYYRREKVFLNATYFRNTLSSYLTPRNTGEINYSTFLPIYSVDAVSALIHGAEAQLTYNITPYIRLASNISYTQGSIRSNNTPLPSIPPLKSFTELRYHNKALSIGAEIVTASAQKRVDIFEEPTEGYTVLNGSFQYTLLTGHLVHSLTVSVENILNKEYRNHLSRIKTILPESGRNFRLIYRFFF